MIDYKALLNRFSEHGKLKDWCKTLEKNIASGLCTKRYGDLPAWYASMASLPDIKTSTIKTESAIHIGKPEECSTENYVKLDSALRGLIPWRKGPYNIFGVEIDTEWRSDWKWDRLSPHISPLEERTILDIGCGNGYHCWRMWGEGARQVLGVDPSPRFIVQFYMLKKLLDPALFEHKHIDILPLGIEHIPTQLEAFDTTFSMGVFYHRRSPMDHLRELKDTLRPGGELVLETLVIDGKLGDVLVPEGRYAKMNNVWFLPSCLTLESWLRKTGYRNIRCVDVNQTSAKEQRATDWMQYQSLPDFLDQNNPALTDEGHPAPKRAIFIAEKPR